MKNALALFAVAGFAAAANADLVSYWNFNAGVPSGDPAPATVAASNGNGSVTSNAVAGTTFYFTGTTVNDQNSSGAGNDYAIQNGVSGANNGSTFTFDFSTAGYEDLVLTFAIRRTSTGFNNTAIQVFDGSGYVNVGAVTYDAGTAYILNTVDLSAVTALENNATASLRFLFSGGSTTSTAGNNRIDNVYFNGTLIPAPGALALAGLAGLVAGRRRR